MDGIVRFTIKHEIANILNYHAYVISNIWKIRLAINKSMFIIVTDINNGWALKENIDIRFAVFSNDNKVIINRAFNNYKGEAINLIERKKFENCRKPLILAIEISSDNTLVKMLDETNKSDDKLSDLQLCRLREYDDLEKILNNETFSDVTINVSGKTFHAHKIILSSRSPVFAAMFNHDMKERKENVINIDDINPEVFAEMLRFMYIAKVENLDKVADNLLPAADKYCLDRLKSICEKCMNEKLSIYNVFHYFKLAIMYNAAYLKREAVEFIKLNRLELNQLNENELKEFFKNIDGNIVCEIVRALTST